MSTAKATRWRISWHNLVISSLGDVILFLFQIVTWRTMFDMIVWGFQNPGWLIN
ncbi:hypothetical protein LINPERPRIM_LOCUS29762 [Linum perenne]